MMCETYECIRPDKGFRFIAEKVKHNPPVVAVRIVHSNPIILALLLLTPNTTCRPLHSQQAFVSGKMQLSRASSGASPWNLCQRAMLISL